jgi:CMP-N-acetylneuraminic acid synthetase
LSKSDNKILCIIPARGGSKGVHRKNIRPIGGKPLIGWTIEVAMRTSCIDRIVVSTDDAEIADIVRNYGIEVPFLRPMELAQDQTPDMPVYEHTLTWLAKHENYEPEIIVWLRPTSPLRTSTDIENAVQLLMGSNSDWVRSVCEVTHHPYWMYKLENGEMKSFVDDIDINKYNRRQLLPPVYRLNGAVDVTWRKTILEKKLNYCGNMQAYIMPVERSLDIDTESDLKLLASYL